MLCCLKFGKRMCLACTLWHVKLPAGLDKGLSCVHEIGVRLKFWIGRASYAKCMALTVRGSSFKSKSAK